MRQWNVVAGMTIFAVFVYVAVLTYLVLVSRIDAKMFIDGFAVVLLPVMGYLARMLNEK